VASLALAVPSSFFPSISEWLLATVCYSVDTVSREEEPDPARARPKRPLYGARRPEIGWTSKSNQRRVQLKWYLIQSSAKQYRDTSARTSGQKRASGRLRLFHHVRPRKTSCPPLLLPDPHLSLHDSGRPRFLRHARPPFLPLDPLLSLSCTGGTQESGRG
jgi:hypothetical protein